jgi:hypothetical protein
LKSNARTLPELALKSIVIDSKKNTLTFVGFAQAGFKAWAG